MKSETFKKILGIVVDVLLIIIVIIAIIISVLTFSSKASDNGVANIMGYSPFAVQSDSMSGTFEKGDLIISQTKDFKVEDIKPGEVITFRASNNKGEEFINTHRVVSVRKVEVSVSNDIVFTTKGDNEQEEDIKEVYSYNVIGIYTGKHISGLGSVMDFLRTQTGFLVCVIIPLALFFFWQLYKFLSIVITKKNQKAMAEGISEEEKKRIAEEYLKQQSASASADAEKKD